MNLRRVSAKLTLSLFLCAACQPLAMENDKLAETRRGLVRGAGGAGDDPGQVLINDASSTKRVGELEQTFAPSELRDVTGLAFRTDSTGDFLYALDRDGGATRIRRYSVGGQLLQLTYEESITLAPDLLSPRGLTWASEDGVDVLYFLEWRAYPLVARVNRVVWSTGAVTSIELTEPAFDLQGQEVLGVARRGTDLLVSYNPSSSATNDLKARRGILQLRLPTLNAANIVFTDPATAHVPSLRFPNATVVKHMPSANKWRPLADGDVIVDPSQGLAVMSVAGTDYLWGSVGSRYVYLADADTGRGIFYFNRPYSTDLPSWGMTAGLDHLWMAERFGTGGAPSVIHRIALLHRPTEAKLGAKRVRNVHMTLTSERQLPTPGYVFHTFGRPFSTDVVPGQGIFPASWEAADLLANPTASVQLLGYNVAGDTSTRQSYALVSYGTGGMLIASDFMSSMDVKVWTADYSRYVYPHLVTAGAPANTNYLADNERLLGFTTGAAEFDAFVERVEAAIEQEYGASARMEDPYWAARNVMEYVFEQYHYPSGDDRVVTPTNYVLGHFDSNPARFKAVLSSGSTWTDNVISCSGSSLLQAAALRVLGVPSRWVGTSTEESPEAWTSGDGDEFLERGEEASATNGHRYAQAWMGDAYGWVTFDGTPRQPLLGAYAAAPARATQFELMTQMVRNDIAGRVVNTIGGEQWDKLYVPFESYDECENDGRCGNERYNLMATYDYPEAFKPPAQTIGRFGVAWVDGVTMSAGSPARVTWSTAGQWGLDPEATVNVELQTLNSEGAGWTWVGTLATGLPTTTASHEFDLAPYGGGQFRAVVFKTGDRVTGNASLSLHVSGKIVPGQGDIRDYLDPLLP